MTATELRIARAVTSRATVPHGMDRDDVHQEVLLAIWQARSRYDPSRGVSWTTFAYSESLWRIGDLHRAASRPIRWGGAPDETLDDLTTKTIQDASPGSEDVATRRDLLRHVWESMTRRERDAVVRWAGDEYTARQDPRGWLAVRRARERARRMIG